MQFRSDLTFFLRVHQTEEHGFTQVPKPLCWHHSD
jgi:hypothetical protein